MPVVQRFGADDAILQLAVKAGKQQAFQTRFAQGQQLVQQAQNNQAQLRALELESQRLSLLSQQARSTFSTPTVSRDIIRSNPFAQSADQAVARIKQPEQMPTSLVNTGTAGAGSVSSGDTEFRIDEEGNITGTKGGELLSPQEVRQRGGFVQAQAPAAISTLAQTKANLIDQVSGLSAQEKQAFLQTAGDEEESLSQFRNRIFQARGAQPTPVSLGQRFSSQVSFIRQQVDDVEAEAAGVEKQLTELDEPINVVGMSLPEISAARTQAQREGDIDKAVLLRRALELREEKRKLRVNEQSLVSSLIQPAQTGVQQPIVEPEQLSDPSQLSDDELRKIAGF